MSASIDSSVSIDQVAATVDDAVMAGLRSTLAPMVRMVKDAQEKYRIMEEVLSGLPAHIELRQKHDAVLARLAELEEGVKVEVREVTTQGAVDVSAQLCNDEEDSYNETHSLSVFLEDAIAKSTSDDAADAYRAVAQYLRNPQPPTAGDEIEHIAELSCDESEEPTGYDVTEPDDEHSPPELVAADPASAEAMNDVATTGEVEGEASEEDAPHSEAGEPQSPVADEPDDREEPAEAEEGELEPYEGVLGEDGSTLEAYLDPETNEVFEIEGEEYVCIGSDVDGEFQPLENESEQE